ncbi:MAG: hypothetical protein AAF497_07240, partial [Planctomycetota bacterium]
MSESQVAPCKLSVQSGRLHVELPDSEKAVPANIFYLRPMTARSEIAFFDDDSKEILTILSVDALSPECQTIART